MKLKSGWMLRTVAATNIVIPVAERVIEFKGMLTLNDTAAFLWRSLDIDRQEEELVKLLMEEYEVAEAEAAVDVAEFINTLRGRNIIEE